MTIKKNELIVLVLCLLYLPFAWYLMINSYTQPHNILDPTPVER